jgi:hypothetical protein
VVDRARVALVVSVVCDLGLLVMAFLVGITITYGSVESVLLMPVRVSVCASLPPGFIEELVYCPICTGFWAQGLASAFMWGDLFAAIRGAFVGVGVMLVLRAVGLDLVRPQHELEKRAIDAVREAGEP